MKWFVALVVVLNLVVAMYGSLKQRPPLDVHAQEVSPGQVKLLPANWRPDASAPKAQASAPTASAPAAQPLHETKAAASAAQALAKAAGKTEASKPAAKAADKPQEKPAADRKAEASACYRWAGLNDSLLARVKGGVPQLKLKSGQLQEESKEESKGAGRFWVYYPPLATQSETKTLSAEMKEKGFDNYIVSNAEFKGNLSLGLFGKEDAAKALAARLKAAGYDKAVVKSKDQPSKVSALTFKDLDAAQAERLQALQKRLTPGIPLKGC
ncbi:SPOR domain-containing protein [Chromobacterium phragmitis]|uniref:SPOR domain-containing protein n=1 Tax=Chromobacterium phragmitis TaxID=2202141 RepID=A0A344UID4_9NEIS|nr:SPOR domain-containing protein [Chromobacterium phragmitis]AXE35032.1 SPOR domain-containing protein [Chromobacterium phragmitis]